MPPIVPDGRAKRNVRRMTIAVMRAGGRALRRM